MGGLIAGLSNRDFAVRQAAEKALRDLGPAAFPALDRVRRDPRADPAARRRARNIIDDMGAPGRAKENW
jgi:hypothetical protein